MCLVLCLQISKTLTTTLQRDSLRADVDRLTATIGDLEAGSHERSLKEKQQREASAKHAEVGPHDSPKACVIACNI